jgi:signal peptidase II
LVTSVGCDQATKVAAIGTLKGHPTRTYLGDLFRLTYAENPGAFLGLGGRLPPEVRAPLFTFGIAILIGALIAYVLFGKHLNRASILCLSLMAGGGVGNLIDRIVRNGVVVDFMNMGIGSVRTGIFNVADVQLMAGAIALLVFIVFTQQPPPEQHPPQRVEEPS